MAGGSCVVPGLPAARDRVMGRRTAEEQRAYMAAYRADPLAAEVHRWSARTEKAAQRELARRHPGEYAGILWEIREKDPKPEAVREADDAAA